MARNNFLVFPNLVSTETGTYLAHGFSACGTHTECRIDPLFWQKEKPVEKTPDPSQF
ncbi:hypothetical protein BT63DRAFT_422929 [Microthyrium microscopicum]|uniref:Uncharacterized protein n=1 Tax=Microthyrium microscopicum TaxID=703497 RepID=A0A6A6UN17_9PEZI|nr:hypothetical protein BT63DRAFT_422929 [Microthyrium microscopicum]